MNSSIPELQYSTPLLKRVRAREAMLLAMAIKYGTDEMVVLRTSRLLEIDEQLNPSKEEPLFWQSQTSEERARITAEFSQWIKNRSLPPLCTYDSRALHMGADPGTVFTNGDDLVLYREIKEREAEA